MRTSIIRLRNTRATHGQHAGLLLQRYLCENATSEGSKPNEKHDLLQAAINAAKNSEVREFYSFAFNRWQMSLPKLTAANDLQTVGRLIVGLGSENVLETGIRLHHTFGIPLIPGSALKGLAAHFCHEVWGESNGGFKKTADYHQILFGTNDESGCIVFHDAWFVPESEVRPLKLDVMTPHHPNWLDGSEPPTDFDSPVPVPFLSVEGQFRVAVSWYGPEHVDAEKWTKLAMDLLSNALSEWGVGGKTTSGYGRLVGEVALSKLPTAIVASSRSPTTHSSAILAKRTSGTQTKVRIVGTREKGYDVQEQGRQQGTLTVGNRPTDVQANLGDDVEVEVHNDDPKKPQYRWPSQQATKKRADRGRRQR